jgi:type II secretory pathway component PulF
MGGWGIALIVISWLTIAIHAFVFIKIVPEFSKLLVEFNVRLPWLTQRFLSLGEWIIAGPSSRTVPGWIVLLPICSLGLIGQWMLLRSRDESTRRLARRLSVVAVIAGWIALSAIMSAFYQPLVAVIDALQGSKL